MHFDFDAHKNLAREPTHVESAIRHANNCAHKGDYCVCKVKSTYLVLLEFSASIRNDLRVIYNTRTGYQTA